MLASLVSIFLQPAVALVAPQSSFYWVYLLCAAIVALLACLSRLGQSGNSSVSAAIREVFNPGIFFHPSAITDYKLVFLNQFISALVLGAGLVSTAAIMHGGLSVLTHVFGPASPRVPGVAATIMFTMTAFLASDFGNFYFHVQQHRAPILWELHKVHHSAEVLTPVTAFRTHPIAELLKAQFIAFCIGLPSCIFLYLYGGPVAELRIAGINLLLFTWQTVLASNLAHSHVWLMYPRGIREIFYSPALHLIHHSARPDHYGKNFGLAVTFWDRLWGTLYEPTEADRRNLVLGIDSDEMCEFRTVGQLYWTPLHNIIFAKRRLAASQR